MQLHPKYFKTNKKQSGAFLVIALILIIVLAALGIASMSETVTSTRVSRNYSQFLAARETARSMADYANRILASYPASRFPGPPTCNSSGTCNVIDATFPNNGRPVLAWTSGLGGATMVDASQPNSWWSTNGFAYEGTFADATNARVVVQQLGENTVAPWQRTYRIVGYATDSTGVVRTTSELFHTWTGYAPDPGDGTCIGGCNYGECCTTTTVCGSDQTSCEDSVATYVPPGWTCTQYFVTGLGYGGTVCANPIAPP